MKFRDSVFLLSIVTIILLCFSQVVIGQQSVNLQKIAGSSGAIHALHHLGNHLYVGAGAQIITLDVTDPSSPTLDSTVSLVNQVRAIAVQEDIVYAAIGFSGLQIIDFTNHTSPILRGVIDTPDFAVDLTMATRSFSRFCASVSACSASSSACCSSSVRCSMNSAVCASTRSRVR